MRMPPRALALLLITAAACVAQPAAVQPALPEQLERLLGRAQVEDRIPAVSVAVADRFRLLWSGAFGLADIENNVRATTGTVFRLGSISKPITAVAALQLAEQGKLDLDAPVQRYVPSFPEKPWPITPRHLLGHLSGIRHYRGPEELLSTRHYYDLVEPLKIFADDPLEFEPGTGFRYTTYGYNLLGAVVEAAAGMRFMDYLKSHVFEPAGVERIQADDVHRIIPNRARGYRRTAAGIIENCALADTSNKIPGGGMVATAEDLVRFSLALLEGRLLKKQTLQEMFTSQRTRNGKPTGYGLGWYVSSRGGRTWIEHSGSQPGAATDLLLLPERGLVVAVLTNLERYPARALSLKVAELLLTGAP
ncbi:MAG: serine hydrolase domain-containing protein [Bryobacterales bacterium]|nr:beta-lactamase family protein [Bryobacteraceae bacterium]MDW8130798.1 serine hydrolase domain-containing protein [Bryobacterales bacterium]